MATALEHGEWVRRYSRLRAIADRIAAMRHERAMTACREAGLDAGIIGIHVHNALVSLHYGKPWEGVNYSKCRLAKLLLDRQFDGYRIVDAWDKRVRGY